jgi:formylglycine-generating enzyme required for sulfatase activity
VIYGLVFLKIGAAPDVRQNDLGFRCATSGASGGTMIAIQSGEFIKGSEDAPIWTLTRRLRLAGSAIARLIDGPERRVSIAAFAVDQTEVTNTQYRQFLDAVGDHSTCSAEERQKFPNRKSHVPEAKFWDDPAFNQPDQPVIGVDWYDAQAYCRWAGKRLPTDQEWEVVARGASGRHYPWGDTYVPNRCNDAENRPAIKATVNVGSLAACRTPEGVMDLVGNADEWTATRTGDGDDDVRRVRGGSWTESGELRGLAYFASSAPPDYRKLGDMGVRCVMDVRQ